MIQMIVDFCNCHMMPADQCVDVTVMIKRGVPSTELTCEVACPSEGESYEKVEPQHIGRVVHAHTDYPKRTRLHS